MSRYDLFRRRIAPIAFFIAIALIAKDTCDKGKRAHSTIELEFADPAGIRAVDVDVVIADDVVATFHCAAPPDSTIGPCRFPVSLTQEAGELRIAVDRGASRQRLTRRFQVIEESTMMVAIPAGP